MARYQWTKLFSIRGGHTYFRDEITKMIALADNSGQTPDRTDDGVLWLDLQRCVSVVTDDNYATWIIIPVLKAPRHGGPVEALSTPASSDEAAAVCSQFGLRVVIGNQQFSPVTWRPCNGLGQTA